MSLWLLAVLSNIHLCSAPGALTDMKSSKAGGVKTPLELQQQAHLEISRGCVVCLETALFQHHVPLFLLRQRDSCPQELEPHLLLAYGGQWSAWLLIKRGSLRCWLLQWGQQKPLQVCSMSQEMGRFWTPKLNPSWSKGREQCFA